jgi:hypothetical protein
MRAKYLQDSEDRSVVVVVEETAGDIRYKAEEARLESLGYRRETVVCGQIYYPEGVKGSSLCHAFYEP